jgi:hypothetical protein
MANYKVIQDIEAEDKLLGPLSLRQFLYAVIVAVLGFVMFKLFFVQPFLIIPFLPPAILFGVLAAPFGHDQSSEIWLLAKIRFFLKPRLRTWDQSGLQELVKITVPKKMIEHLTNGLDQTQVQSRLEALAQTIDTRGWAVKGVDVNLYTNPGYATPASSDRLVDPVNVVAAPVPNVDIQSADDILDTQHSAVAQHMNELVQASDQARRQALMDRMDQARTTTPPATPAAMPTVAQAAVTPTTPPVAAPADIMPATMSLPTAPHQNAYGQTAVLQPLQPLPNSVPQKAAVAPVTAAPKPAILQLASNDDLSVATIARQANQKQGSDGEVVISLR